MEGKIDKTGVMIHKVISEVDMGSPILVREIPFIKGTDEDLKALEQRIHEIEWNAVVEGTEIALKELRDEKNTIPATQANPPGDSLEDDSVSLI